MSQQQEVARVWQVPRMVNTATLTFSEEGMQRWGTYRVAEKEGQMSFTFTWARFLTAWMKQHDVSFEAAAEATYDAVVKFCGLEGGTSSYYFIHSITIIEHCLDGGVGLRRWYTRKFGV